MTYQEARKVVKERGATKYQGKKFILLLKLAESLYRKTDEDGPVAGRTATKRIETIKGWLGGISDRQLNRLLKAIEELMFTRDDGELTYTINFEPLLNLEKSLEVAKRQESAKNKTRAEKARNGREEKRRERERIIEQYEHDQRYSSMTAFELVVAARNWGTSTQPIASAQSAPSEPAKVRASKPAPAPRPLDQSAAMPTLTELEERWRNEKDNALRAKHRAAFMAAREAQHKESGTMSISRY